MLSTAPRVSKRSPKDADRNGTYPALDLRYHRLFEAAPYGILLLDGETARITDANPFAVDLLGYPFAELCGQELWEMGRYEDIALGRAFLTKLRKTRRACSDYLTLRNKAGQLISVEIEGQAYHEGERETVQCTLRQTTEADQGAPAALDSREQQAWLLAHSQRLRTPLTEIAWMLGLMELERSLVPQSRSAFDETALRHVRRNLQTLVHTFNDLSVATGQSPLWLAHRLSPDDKTSGGASSTSRPGFRDAETGDPSLQDQSCHS